MTHLNGHWSDLVTNFLELTTGVISPDLFKRWSAIALVGAALERRVWAQVGYYKTFPNQYVLLVGPPGVGKQVIEVARDLLAEVPAPGSSGTASPAFHVAPDGLTKAAMIDSLADAKRSHLPPSGPIQIYHSLAIMQEEFGVLLPAYDQEFIANFNKIYNNNEATYRERRRTGNVRKVEIEKAQLNLLAGCTPSYFTGTFPEEAWTTGFARRIIMVYSSEAPSYELFATPPDASEAHQAMLIRLRHLSGLWGPALWRPAAAEKIADWHRAGGGSKGGPPVPGHSKLEHYCRSRSMHVVKLAIVSAVSRSGELVIELVDAERAIAWLLEAESTMPDIFRAMTGKSDAQVIEEMHYFVQAQWARDRGKPVAGEIIRRFLLSRVPHDKVETLMLTGDRAGIVCRVAGTPDSWIPKPRMERGVE